MHLIDHFCWKCKNCPKFTARLKMVAKRHARRCGERPKWPKERSAVARHPCSACPQKFSTKKALKAHYAALHPRRKRAYKCTLCQTKYSAWKNLKRHMHEKHGQHEWQCSTCDATFSRRQNLVRHFASKHGKQQKSLSPLLQRVQDLIGDLESRQLAGPLSILEENRLQNLFHQREMLLKLDEVVEGGEGEVEVDEGSVEKGARVGAVKRKRSSDNQSKGVPVRKSARLQVIHFPFVIVTADIFRSSFFPLSIALVFPFKKSLSPNQLVSIPGAR